MPRSGELPPALKSLSRYNAISISDSRWDEDVRRLAQIVALDIPSQIERKLRMVNFLVSGFVALFVTILVALAAFTTVKAFGFSVIDFGDNACVQNPGWEFISKKQAGVLFVVTALASVALFVAAPWVTAPRRRYLVAAGLVGALGTLGLLAEAILRTNPTPPASRWLTARRCDPVAVFVTHVDTSPFSNNVAEKPRRIG